MKGFLGMGLDDGEIVRYCLEVMDIPEWERFIPKEDQQAEPDPKTVVEMMKLELEQEKLSLEVFKAEAQVAKMHAEAILALAKAESQDIGDQIELYKIQMQSLTERFKAKMSKESKNVKSEGSS